MPREDSQPAPSNILCVVVNVVGCLLFAAVVAALSVRLSQFVVAPENPQRGPATGHAGLADFQDVIYYPAQAVRDGVNPYDSRMEPLADGSLRYRQRYPVHNHFPLYSPLTFALFLPWTVADFYPSAIAFVIFNLGLLLLFAWYCWHIAGIRPTIGQTTILASVILITQAGRANFLGGDTALPLTLATLAAARLAPQRPWLAGITLAITSFKPTYGLPLGILLLAAGYYRTVFVGWGLGFLIGMGGLLIIFGNRGDLANMPQILRYNVEVLNSDPEANALSTAIRIDAAGALERLSPVHNELVAPLMSLIVLAIPCCGLWWLRKVEPNAETKTLTLAMIAAGTVACMFHVTYDALIFWGAIFCLAFTSQQWWPHVSSRWRLCVAALLFLPMINALGSKTMLTLYDQLLPALATVPSFWQEAAWTLVCTINGLALLVALILMTAQARCLASADSVGSVHV